MSYIINSYQFKKETPKKKLRKIIIDALSIKNSLIHKNEPFLKPRVQFLYFHHCFDDQIESLEILINRLMIHHEFISYSEGIKILKSKKIDRPYIVICSDDGFKNNLNASRIFAKYKISACFFINPYSINLNDFNSIKEFCAQKLSSPPTEFLSWNDIDYLLKDGHEVGSHAWDHLNLNLISKKESYYQLKKSFDLLKDICGDNVHFSWPYGRTHHFNNDSEQDSRHHCEKMFEFKHGSATISKLMSAIMSGTISNMLSTHTPNMISTMISTMIANMISIMIPNMIPKMIQNMISITISKIRRNDLEQ